MKWEPYNIVKPTGKYLYKFLSEKYLEDFLNTGDIWFARSDVFGDKMECLMIDDLKNGRPDFQKIESRKKKHLISCFHIGTYETLALWDTYAKQDNDRRKYAIRFNLEQLVTWLADATVDDKKLPATTNLLIHGNVKYKNIIAAKADKYNQLKVKHPSFRKEAAFTYEKEYRFVFRLKNEFIKKGVALKIGETRELNFTILVNPFLEDNDFKSALRFIKDKGYGDKWKLSPITKWVKPKIWDITLKKYDLKKTIDSYNN